MNWDVFTKLSSLQIQLHWATVSIAFFIGITIFVMRKGTSIHKALGRIFVLLMFVTSGAAFFIRSGRIENPGLFEGFTPIHLFIPLTVLGSIWGVINIRRGNVRGHASTMIGVFMGALIIAGVFTFLPGRRMHLLFFGDKADIEQRVDSSSTED